MNGLWCEGFRVDMWIGGWEVLGVLGRDVFWGFFMIKCVFI